MVQQGTQTGAGQRIRVRGVSSISLSNEPIFVIDGIRMSSQQRLDVVRQRRRGLQPPRRHQPGRHREHRNREGTVGGDAVRHRRGERRRRDHDEEGSRRHRASGRCTARAALLDDRNWYADNYTLAGMNPTTKAKLILSGQCTLVDGLARHLREERRHQGLRQPSRLQPDQGSDTRPRSASAIARRGAFRSPAATTQIRYFMSGGRDDEIGVFKLDNYEQRPLRLRSASRSTRGRSVRTRRLLNAFRAQHQRAGESAVRRGDQLRLQHGRTR